MVEGGQDLDMGSGFGHFAGIVLPVRCYGCGCLCNTTTAAGPTTVYSPAAICCNLAVAHPSQHVTFVASSRGQLAQLPKVVLRCGSV